MPEEGARPQVSVIDTLRRASALVPGFRRGLTVTVLFAAGGALGRLVLPVLLQRTINEGFRGDSVDADLVFRYCTVAVVAIVFFQVCSRVASYRLGAWSEWLMSSLRSRCIDRFLSISLDQHARQRKGVLVARVTTDIESIARFFEWGAISWVINSMILIVLSSYVLITDLRLGLIALVIASPIVIVMLVLQRRILRAYEQVRTHVGSYLARTGEVVSGAAVIRAYRAERTMQSSADAAIENRRRAQVRAGTLGALLFPAGELFAAAAVSTVVLAAVADGPGGGLSEGAVVGVIFATIRLLDPVAEISENIDQTQMAVAGLSRVLDVVDLPVEITDPTSPAALPEGPLAIALDDVWYVYPDRPDAHADDGNGPPSSAPSSNGARPWTLHGISLEAPVGTSLALVGATGSGKSTAALLLVRLADPQRGRVLIGGTDIRDVDDATLRRRVQLVPQEPFLFEGTIGDNLRSGRTGASDEDIAQAVRRLGLEEWVASLASGLATRVGERGADLSAGERQLVALLRAEVIGPDVLILDEATSSVDAAMEARLSRTIEQLAHGRTMIVIAHRLSTAARADRIAVLSHGRLVQTGTHAELMATEGPYARIADEWAKGVRV